jgi:ATP-dependent Clp protease adaptor protein ClpS
LRLKRERNFQFPILLRLVEHPQVPNVPLVPKRRQYWQTWPKTGYEAPKFPLYLFELPLNSPNFALAKIKVMAVSNQPLHEDEVLLDEAKALENRLIVYNDEINTFEWVIETLIKVCQHTFEQAEQCAYIIHYKGKYAVTHGNLQKLRPMREAISDRGIGATIE